ncbi:hypothetical protein EV421DRAFT_1997524 [Armillaria borealis]|uniref:Ubiquitin-like protease family profile domain-containing protein n=1 Tax=Armillaria borealis TaxID=47425 RepID=A0AA39MGU0_9AGAR|nr:hypothetical protein EV421DRAFT_1997524 [Armillaria borealis]
MSSALKLSPVKRKRDRKDTTKRVGDAAYDYARQALVKRVKEAEERARQRADNVPFSQEDNLDGWEDEDGSGSRTYPESGQEYDATPSLEGDEDDRPVIDLPTPTKGRRTQPNTYTQNLYRDWKALLPHLVKPLASFQQNSTSKTESPSLLSSCNTSGCNGIHQRRDVLCLYWNSFETRSFHACQWNSESLPMKLVEHGLFPTSPREPRVAVSIDLLTLYQSLLEHSGTSNSAFCSALQDFYVSRGFWMHDTKGAPMEDPFRQDKVDAILSDSRAKIPDTFAVPDETPQPIKDIDTGLAYIRPANGDRITISLTRGRASDLLQQRCPACFSGTRFGRGFSDGGDVHVAIDCNFHHRHRTSAGDCPDFYDPRYVLSKQEVDAAGTRIDIARKSGAKTGYKPKIPDVAVDEDEKSFEAADEKKEKTHGGRYDDTGLAALVCRHDVPLFLANVDTPGEQQKYAVALIEHLASHLPPAASIAVLYDIGCVLDRSVNLYDIFPPTLTERLMFATSAMHAYGHQWSCQLVYNPRLRSGLGLTDVLGDGSDSIFWISQAAFVARSIREDLGGWIRRKVKDGVEKKGAKARADLESSDAPAQLKKELDAVLTLQGHADTIESAIQATRLALTSSATTVSHHNFDLTQLSSVHQQLCNKIDQLYLSLNVDENFPELAGFDVTFVQTLLLARDLKINICKRAIGTFFEWDRLDQATGGREQALGTKLHQQTRKSISRRKPALLAAIRKFNGYVGELKHLAAEKHIQFPLPRRLSTDLAHLKNDDDLLQDVWIQTATTEVPAWLTDADVRRGIRAMLQLDRCLEERRRLGREADNLLTWFERELIALEISFKTVETNSPFIFSLQRRRERIQALQHKWKNPFVSDVRWHAAVQSAQQTAELLCNGTVPSTIHFLSPTIIPETSECSPSLIIALAPSDNEDEGGDDEEGFSNDESECLADILDDLAPSEPDVLWEVPQYSENGEQPSEISSHSGDVSPSMTDVAEADEPEYKYEELTFNIPSTELLKTKDIARYRPRCKAKKWTSLVFDAGTLRRLYTPTALLNDDAINGCAALLFDAFPSPQAILFSTYDLVALQDKSDMETLWRYTQSLKFWTYEQWIIPIHRPHQVHWTLATVNIATKTLDLFDSLADHDESERDIRDVLSFIEAIATCARQRGCDIPVFDTPEPWKVTTLITRPIQHNGYDCGVWVLSQIHALLRGHRQTAIKEVDIVNFRAHCLSMVLGLSTWNSA